MKFLVTGATGFIGMHTALALLARGDDVVGIDNNNDYYDPRLKEARLALIQSSPGADRFQFIHLDVADRSGLEALFNAHTFDGVVHLAAQAGVRYSLTNPHAYAQSNLVGFVNILEGCRHHAVHHLVYASSSSVYGGNTKMPFEEGDRVDHPVSLYAATKKANELMAHTYSHLYGLPTTGLRFFTVYGPWGRPDMAPMLFTNAILKGEAIKVFNHGDMLRDFTYVGDIVKGVIATLDRPPSPSESISFSQADRPAMTAAESWAPYRVLNIGNNEPVALMQFIRELEVSLGKQAELNLLPMQPGDVPATYADTARLEALTGFRPTTPLSEGIRQFVAWYLEYHGDQASS
jgi:UDP-glucuronate 4-epimerase